MFAGLDGTEKILLTHESAWECSTSGTHTRARCRCQEEAQLPWEPAGPMPRAWVQAQRVAKPAPGPAAS